MKNTIDIKYFIIFFINYRCGESLLISKKVMLVMRLDEN